MTENHDRYGNIEIDTSGYEKNPISEFLENKKDETSEENYRFCKVVLGENRNKTGFQQFLNIHQISVFEATTDDLEDYAAYIRSQGVNKTTGKRLELVSALYARLRELGVHDSNPAAYVLDEGDFDRDPPERDYHTVAEIGDFIRWITDPQIKTIALLVSKTGIRAGEVTNIDLRCLNLDDSRYREDYLTHHGIELKDEVKTHPDTLYIVGDISAGEVVDGEERMDGNKRKRSTLIPIDRELKRSMLNWLSIRPRIDTTPQPLFTTEKTVNGEFKRISRDSIYGSLVRRYAVNFGLAEPGENSEDVDIHYFRHFFTTQMSKNRGDHDGGLDPMLVKYIRGDVIDDDILDIYSHDSWGVNVREEYLNNIYNFGVYE